MRRYVFMAAASAAIVALSGCSDGTISAKELSSAFGLAYQRLYVLQQADLGRAASAPDRTATCTRSGSAATTGSGSWVCTVHYPYADGHQVPLSFDVEVQPVGCYTATGPPAVIGQLQLTTPSGASRVNPLFAFDGCFDPH